MLSGSRSSCAFKVVDGFIDSICLLSAEERNSSTIVFRLTTSFAAATPLATVSKSETTSAALCADSFILSMGFLIGFSSGKSIRSRSG